MVEVYRPEGDKKYDCPKRLRAVIETFSSLQCDKTACSGDLDSKRSLARNCEGCENYFINAIERDKEELSRPVSWGLQSQ